MLESIVLGVLLAAPCCAVMAALASLQARAARAPAVGGPDGGGRDRPAAVNLVLHKCSANTAAYQATILDLAARGFLAATEDRDVLWLTRSDPGPGAPVLTGYEQRVLGDMRARLAGTSGAPFPALADACTADPQGIWEPFAQKLLTEARDAGLCRTVLPATGRTAAQATVGIAAVAVAAFLIARAHPLAAMAGPGITAAVSVIAFVVGVLMVGSQNRLTPAGAELAARWRREAWADAPAMPLQRRAYAVAAGVAPVFPGPAVPAGRRSRPPRPARPGPKHRPAQAWSSFSGTWRPVAIEPDFSAPEGLGGILAVLAGAVWFGMITFILTVIFPVGAWALLPLAAAVLLAVLALKMFARWSAAPGPSTFDGQVIARWKEEKSSGEDSTVTVPYVAIDDGQRGWTFGGYGFCSQLALGDVVRLTVSPRSGQVDLTVTSSPRAASAAEEPAEPAPLPRARLLTAADAETLLGPVELTFPMGTPGGSGIMYRGSGRRSLIVTVCSGRLANLNASYGRKHGTPVWGVGDEAWSLHHGRYVIFRVGDEVVKVHAVGPASAADPDLLRTLSATLAERLAALVPGGP